MSTEEHMNAMDFYLQNEDVKDHSQDENGGLCDDDENEDVIYLCHASDPDKKFTVLVKNLYTKSGEIDVKKNTYKSEYLVNIMDLDATVINCIDSPIMISVGTFDGFMFVIKYLDFYEKVLVELPGPEAPLDKSLSLEEILGEDYLLFKPIIECQGMEKYLELSKILTLAQYLSMHKLFQKACAIFGYFLSKLQSSKDIENLTSFLNEHKS